MSHRQASEERGRMGLLTRVSERSGHEPDRPASLDQRPRQVARHLCRPTTRKEHKPHHNMTLHHPGTLRPQSQATRSRIVRGMPSDMALKAMNRFHRVLLKITVGRLGWRVLRRPALELTTTGHTRGEPAR